MNYKEIEESKDIDEEFVCPYCNKKCFLQKPCRLLKEEDQKAEQG